MILHQFEKHLELKMLWNKKHLNYLWNTKFYLLIIVASFYKEFTLKAVRKISISFSKIRLKSYGKVEG